MEDYKQIIAKNIGELRKAKKLTQAELAEKLNYSDKAVSRWERGDTLPAIDVLCKICELFNVDLSYLVSADNSQKKSQFYHNNKKTATSNKIAMCLLGISLVWLVATCIYVYSNISASTDLWIVFVWAVPATALVAEIFNLIWGKKIYSVITRSVLIWTLITAFYIHFITYNMWLIFLICVPAQACIILWSKIK